MTWLRILPILVVTGLLAQAADPASGASKRILPSNDAPKLEVRIGKKPSSYHTASADHPLEFRIKGPALVRVLSRYVYDGAPPEAPVPYRLRFQIDGVELGTVPEKGVVSRQAHLADGGPIGSLERGSIRVPAGSHKVFLRPVEEGAVVAVRLFEGDRRPAKVSWVSYAPETYERAVLLRGGDTEVTYYRFGTETPVTFPIHGPARLRVRTRLDFGVAHGRSQSYAVKLSLDGKAWKALSFKSHVSDTSIYPDLPDLTPGIARDFDVEVPRGEHRIEILLDCTTARAAALRMLIPKKDVMPG